MGNGAAHRPRHAVMAGIVGLVVLVPYAVVGTLQVLVWNPLAAVPGATLEEIHADLARANETLAAPVVITWAIVGVVSATLVLMAAIRWPAVRALYVVAADLLLLFLAAPAYWAASFPGGMGLADAFNTSGGDHTPWGFVLYGVSFVALAVLWVIVIRVIVVRTRVAVSPSLG